VYTVSRRWRPVSPRFPPDLCSAANGPGNTAIHYRTRTISRPSRNISPSGKSLVLTETDYIASLVELSHNENGRFRSRVNPPTGASKNERSDRRCDDAGLVLAETSNGDRYRGAGFCLITGVGILG
jgi:hypothetical protein